MKKNKKIDWNKVFLFSTMVSTAIVIIFTALIPIAMMYITIKSGSFDFLIQMVITFAIAGYLYLLGYWIDGLFYLIKEYNKKYKTDL